MIEEFRPSVGKIMKKQLSFLHWSIGNDLQDRLNLKELFKSEMKKSTIDYEMDLSMLF